MFADVVLLQGSFEVVIKIALVVLATQKELIKNCMTFESIVNCLKVTLPSMGIIQMERVFNQVPRCIIPRACSLYCFMFVCWSLSV